MKCLALLEGELLDAPGDGKDVPIPAGMGIPDGIGSPRGTRRRVGDDLERSSTSP